MKIKIYRLKIIKNATYGHFKETRLEKHKCIIGSLALIITFYIKVAHLYYFIKYVHVMNYWLWVSNLRHWHLWSTMYNFVIKYWVTCYRVRYFPFSSNTFSLHLVWYLSLNKKCYMQKDKCKYFIWNAHLTGCSLATTKGNM